MKVNANKFEILQYGKEQEIKSATTYKSHDDSNIDHKYQVRDKGKGKVFYGQEPPSAESTTTECGFNYQLLQ